MKTHYHVGVTKGGRFAITACAPDGIKTVAYTTSDWKNVDCKKCLNKKP